MTISLIGLPSTSKSFTYAQTQNAQGKQPNILLIVGDDFGFSDVGPFGGEISTPNLDELAKDGKILTNYHTNPTCSPARAALLTGVDNHIAGLGSMGEKIVANQVGKPGYEGYLNDRVVTLPELLKDSGYHTLMTGKWHLSGTKSANGTSPYDRGFEEVLTLVSSGGQHFNSDPYYAGGHPTFMHNNKIVPRPDNTTYSNDLYANTMVEQIKKFQNDDKPLFMYLSFQVAHSPFQAPQEYITKYQDTYNVGYDKIREQRFEKQKQLGIWSADMKLPQRIPSEKAWDNLSADEKAYRAKVLAVHAAMIDNMDYNIGKVIKYLKDSGKYDNTLIIFTSDNGSSEPINMNIFAGQAASKEETQKFLSEFNNTVPNLGNPNSLVNYGLWGTMPSVSPLSYFKASQGEGGIRSPFIIKLPNDKTKSSPDILKAYANVRDITPTLLEFSGVQPSVTYNGKEVHPIMGKSLKPLLEGKVDRIYSDKDFVAQELFNNTSVFLGDWKAVKNERPISDGKWHLFNVTADIGENVDLASQNPQVLEKMIQAYDKYAKEVGVVVPSDPVVPPDLYQAATMAID